MRIHLAAICSGQSANAYRKNNLYPKFILESFFYLEDWLFEFPTFHPDNFMLDSGAFTFMNQKDGGQVDWDEYVERYAQVIVERGIKFFFELDIDSLVGIKEVERLREKLERLTGKKSIPVFHKSRGQQYWFDMLAAYDYVALGGIVTKEIKAKEYEFFKWFLRTAREKKVKVHGLGFTNFEGLLKYPFYSVDSSSWIGSRYGNLYRFDGLRMKKIKRPKNVRMTDYKLFNKNNLSEWMKFQIYAEKQF